jgi:putative FmdB family regulatory protein
MPTYGYRCEKNGHEFEVVQGITDPPLTRCKICGSKVRRIFYPVGIVFKGPGFYKTDSRTGPPASAPTAATAEGGDKERGGKESAKEPSTKEGTDRPVTAKKAESRKKGETQAKKSA